LTASAVAQEQPVLNVSNVDELYAAVNNPANAGAMSLARENVRFY
jgi:hypothetical protein